VSLFFVCRMLGVRAQTYYRALRTVLRYILFEYKHQMGFVSSLGTHKQRVYIIKNKHNNFVVLRQQQHICIVTYIKLFVHHSVFQRGDNTLDSDTGSSRHIEASNQEKAQMEESKMKLVVGRGDDMADDRSLSKDVKHASLSQPGPEVYGERSSGKIPFISRSARTSTDSSDDAVARVSASDPSGTSSAPGEDEDESATEASKSGKKRPLDPFSESRDLDSGAEPLEGDEDEESAENKPKLGSLEGNQAKWDDIFGRLLRYKEEHGDCLVPNRFEPDPSLGAWVSTQRR
jgi:hypothetical protein